MVEGLGKDHANGLPLVFQTTSAAGALAAAWRLPSRVRHAATCRPLRFSEKVTQERQNLGGKRLSGGSGGGSDD